MADLTTGGSDSEEVARLRAERDQLQSELEHVEKRARTGSWWRRTITAVLVVLAVLSFTLAVPGIWARRNFLDTNRFVDRSAPLIEDPAVQQAITFRLTEQLMLLINPRALFEEVLPERGQLLAVPLAGAVTQFVNDRVEAFVASDTFSQLWASIIEVAHRASVHLLKGEDGEVVSTANGQVTLNLIPVVDAVLKQIGSASPEIFGREIDIPDITVEDIPEAAITRIESAFNVQLDEDFGQITVYEKEKLGTAQDAINLFDRLVVVLLPLSIVAAALAMLLSRRRRRTLLQLSVGVVLGMVLLRRAAFALQEQAAELPPTATGRSAAAVVLDTFLDPLLTFALWAGVIAIAVIVLAALTGSYGWAVSLRRRVVALWSSVVSATGDRARDETTVAWVRGHRDVLLGGGAFAGLLVLWVADLGWLALLAVLAAVVAFEAAVYRIGAPEPTPEPTIQL